jgi:hypothetical protein
MRKSVGQPTPLTSTTDGDGALVEAIAQIVAAAALRRLAERSNAATAKDVSPEPVGNGTRAFQQHRHVLQPGGPS